MIKVEKIQNLVELAILSAYLKGEQPVSLLITAPVEAGKTELLLQFASNKGVLVLTDATAFGIMRDYGQPIINRQIRHLIIADLIKPMSRSKDTVHTLITFLNGLLEEGIFRMSTYADKTGSPLQGIAINQQPIPVKCGLITTMAKEVLLDGRHHWSRVGFMSRLLPISYDYTVATQAEIHESISKRAYLENKPIELDLPNEDVDIELPQKQAEQLTLLSSFILSSTRKDSPERVYGFRLHKHLQRLAMANALKEKRDKVQDRDAELLRELSVCLNLDYYPL
jgi:hypothetical protein